MSKHLTQEQKDRIDKIVLLMHEHKSTAEMVIYISSALDIKATTRMVRSSKERLDLVARRKTKYTEKQEIEIKDITLSEYKNKTDEQIAKMATDKIKTHVSKSLITERRRLLGLSKSRGKRKEQAPSKLKPVKKERKIFKPAMARTNFPFASSINEIIRSAWI